MFVLYFIHDITSYFTHGGKSLARANKSIARFDSWKTDGPFSEVTSLSSYNVTLVPSCHPEEDNRIFNTYSGDENIIKKKPVSANVNIKQD